MSSSSLRATRCFTFAMAALLVNALNPIRLVADDRPAVDESQAPPVRYVLTIGDQRIPIVEGKTQTLSGTFQNPQVRLQADPNRVFPYRGVKFEYPRDYTFEADLDPFGSMWTLAGTDYTIMVMENADRISPADLLDGIETELGSTSSGRKAVQLTMRASAADHTAGAGGQANSKLVLQGVQDRFSLGNQVLHYEVYELPPYHGKQHFLTLLDVLDERGQPSADAQHSRRLLTQTLQIKERDL